MPTITLNKTVFEKLVGKELSLEELKDRISMLGTDLESIEGDEINVEIFPNRPDLLSEQGFARAFSSFIGVKTGLRKYEVKDSGEEVIIDPSVKDIRPHTACAIVKNLKFNEEKIREIIQIQEKLHVTFGRNRKKAAIGVYPLDKITFPVTFKADEPENIVFQPLEADREMNALKIISQHKAGREFGHLLEGLDKFPFFIDAKERILSMPPIINSNTTGRISKETKNVFIECSGFDFNTLSTCLNMIVTSLADMGGDIYSINLKNKKSTKTPNLKPAEMKLDLPYVNKILGLKLSEEQAKELLEKMGFGYEKNTVLIPAYRTDILHQVDLVEDIAIAYGYENFEEEIPNVATIGEESSAAKFQRKIQEILVGSKLLEVKNYHLIAKEDLNEKMNQEQDLIPLLNALGEHNHLRNAILPSLMKSLRENQHNEYPQNLFEIGKVFEKGDSETGIVEKDHLGIILCGMKTDFTEIRQILESLISALGLKCSIKEAANHSFIKGRVGDIFVGSEKWGIIGEIHPSVLEKWGLVVPVVGLELNISKLKELIC